jgi:hypothetical protein
MPYISIFSRLKKHTIIIDFMGLCRTENMRKRGRVACSQVFFILYRSPSVKIMCTGSICEIFYGSEIYRHVSVLQNKIRVYTHLLTVTPIYKTPVKLGIVFTRDAAIIHYPLYIYIM